MAVVITALSLLGSLLGFLQQQLLAWLFGATGAMDAFVAAFSLPLMVSGTISAVIGYAVYPILLRTRINGGRLKESVQLILGLVLFTAIATGACGILFESGISSLLFRGFSSEMTYEALKISRVAWVASIGLVLQAYLAVVLNVRNWFVGSVCLGMGAHICGVLSGVIWGRQYGPIAIAIGILVGTFLATFVALWAVRKDFFGFSQSSEGREDLRHLIAIAIPVALGSAAFTSLQVIDTFWAHQLNEGNLSQLGYAHRILVALGTLLIAAPSVLLTPTLVKASASGHHGVFREKLWVGISSVALIGSLLAVSIFSLAEPLVHLLFQHGKFLARDADAVATLIRIMLPGMVLMSVTVVLYRGLISHHRSSVGIFVGSVLIFSYFVLSGVFISKWGVLGVAVAYSTAWLLTCLFTLAIVGLIAKIKQNAALLFDALWKLGVIGIVVFGTTYRASFESVNWSSTLSAIVHLCVGCCVALGAIYILFIKSKKWNTLSGINW